MSQAEVKLVAPSFTLEQINKAVEQMAKAQVKSVDAIAKVLVMAVYASIVGIEKDHVAVAKMVIANLRKSVKSKAIIDFLEEYGQLAYIEGKWQHFTQSTKARSLKWTPEYSKTVQDAAAVWESFRTAPVVTEFDVEAKIRGIIADAAKRQKDNKPVKNADILADLPAILAKHSSLKANADLAKA
jgi:hypothetical protein